MPRALVMPSEEELPAGPHRKFLEELHLYYRAAGRPKLARILQVIHASVDAPPGDAPDMPPQISRETIRRILKGKSRSDWTKVELLFEAFCAISNRDPEADRWAEEYSIDEVQSLRDWIRELWSNAMDEVEIRGSLPAPRKKHSEPSPSVGNGGWGNGQDPPF
ncbi:hypothetical protein [Streptomyces sp. RG80]|uniref:hypothetical protein n=1 Tax=Streptomyces sp. RG80 TaxID=3157340 RepID=UPI00338D60D2